MKCTGSFSIFASFALLFAFSGDAWPQQDWSAFDGLIEDTCSVDKPCGPGVSTATAIPALELIGISSRPSLELSGSRSPASADSSRTGQSAQQSRAVTGPSPKAEGSPLRSQMAEDKPAQKPEPASLPKPGRKEKNICIVYFTGAGCPVCAKADPAIFTELPKSYPNLVVIEYEVYRRPENAPLLMKYDEKYNCGIKIPVIILGKDKTASGKKIVPYLKRELKKLKSNRCPLIDGSSVDFSELDAALLPGSPALIDLSEIGKAAGHQALKDASASPPEISGSRSQSAIQKYQEAAVPPKVGPYRMARAPHAEAGKPAGEPPAGKAPRKNLRLSKILIIALADTINPCALAVFVLMLIGILSYNATSRRAVLSSTTRRAVLHAGFAFTLAVFIMYFIYGLIIIRFWQLVQALTSVRLWLHTILGIAAICLGIFHLKDFFWYKPGSFATEMPVGWRGTVRRMMIRITSPAGAFFMGAFVTLFLIPCTMGPYLIAGGILSQLELVKTIPWLIIYNLVFIAPLIGIVYIVYFGFRKVEDVSQWKDRNIRKLHLIVALIMIPMGLAILLGWL